MSVEDKCALFYTNQSVLYREAILMCSMQHYSLNFDVDILTQYKIRKVTLYRRNVRTIQFQISQQPPRATPCSTSLCFLSLNLHESSLHKNFPIVL